MDVDLDSIPHEVQEALDNLAKHGAMGEGFKTELTELLDVFNYSQNQTSNTERKIEEIYSEIHFAQEQVVSAQRMEEEAIVAKQALQETIERSKVSYCNKTKLPTEEPPPADILFFLHTLLCKTIFAATLL